MLEPQYIAYQGETLVFASGQQFKAILQASHDEYTRKDDHKCLVSL